MKETSLGGAEAGRGGRGLGVGSDLDDNLRLREGGESRVVSVIGVVGGVAWGVVGVAGWITIASFGETSKGVSLLSLEPLLGGLTTSSSNMVREQRQETQGGDHCELVDDGRDGRSSLPLATAVNYGADLESYLRLSGETQGFVQRLEVRRKRVSLPWRTRFMDSLSSVTFILIEVGTLRARSAHLSLICLCLHGHKIVGRKERRKI